MSDVLRPNLEPITGEQQQLTSPEGNPDVVANSAANLAVPGTAGKSDYGKIFSFHVGEVKIYLRLKQFDFSRMDETESLLYIAGETSKIGFPSTEADPAKDIPEVDGKTRYLTFMANLLTNVTGSKQKLDAGVLEQKLDKIAADEEEMVFKVGDRYDLQYSALKVIFDGAVDSFRPKVPKSVSVKSGTQAKAQEAKSQARDPNKPMTKAEWRDSDPDISDPKPKGYKGPHPAIVKHICETIAVCRILVMELGDEFQLDSINYRAEYQKIASTPDADRAVVYWERKLQALKDARLVAYKRSQSKRF